MDAELVELGEKRRNPKISTLSSKGQVVIPKNLRDSLSLDSGESVLMIEVKGGIFLTKFDDDLFKKMMKDFKTLEEKEVP
jgi:AbrB family looped-hinge helix DNA binding protein